MKDTLLRFRSEIINKTRVGEYNELLAVIEREIDKLNTIEKECIDELIRVEKILTENGFISRHKFNVNYSMGAYNDYILAIGLKGRCSEGSYTIYKLRLSENRIVSEEVTDKHFKMLKNAINYIDNI